MALSYLTKAQIRRHLRLPFAGSPVSGEYMGIRAVTKAGNLERYMDVMQAEEEAILLGKALALLQCYGGNRVGDVISLQLTQNGTTVTASYTVQASDVTAINPPNNIAIGVVNAINALTFSDITASTGVYQGQTGVSVGIPPTFGQVTITSANVFTAVLLSGPGCVLTEDGTVLPDPSFTIDNSNPAAPVIIHGILPICNALESALVNASANLSFSLVGSNVTGQAQFRKDELQVRQSLYKAWTYQLGVMLAYYPPPYSESGIRSFGIRI